MSEKTLKTRIQNKRGTTAEWATGTAPNFVPKDGEIVAYTDVHRIKIGDGNTKVSALPFVDKVRDVTLGGESIVNANGVVELQPTEMSNGCIPVWNNTEKIFEDSRCHNNIDGLFVEGNIGMYSYEYTLDVDVREGSFSYSDDAQATVKKYSLPITKNSGTLATMYKKYKKFTAFAVGDNLSGKTLLFNTEAAYSQYFSASKIIVTSSGGYTISIASGPPTIRLLKNDTVVQLFADWALRPDGTSGTVWRVSSYTLPSDFGTVSTLNTESGGSTYTSIWNTLGLDGAATEYDFINVEDVYNTIPKIVDSLYVQNSSAALSANQGYQLDVNKAPKASPIFTGTVVLSGTTTPLSVSSSVGMAGQVLTSQGTGKSPIWKTFTASAPSNMVTTDTIQTITGAKTFSATQQFTSSIQVDNGGDGITLFNSASSFAIDLTIDENVNAPQEGATVNLPVVDRQSSANIYLIGAASNGTKGQVLTSAAAGNAATWSTLPEFAMNLALPISYRISSSSNGYYSSVSYGTAVTTNCLMMRNLADHTLLNRHMSYCIHLSTTIAAGRWVRFDVPGISYNGTTYYPYIKTITATAIRPNTNTTPPSLVTYISNNQSSGSMAYIGCCSQQISGLDVRIDCTVS